MIEKSPSFLTGIFLHYQGNNSNVKAETICGGGDKIISTSYKDPDKYGWVTGIAVGFCFLAIIALVIVFFYWKPKFKVPIDQQRSTAWKEFNSNNKI